MKKLIAILLLLTNALWADSLYVMRFRSNQKIFMVSAASFVLSPGESGNEKFCNVKLSLLAWSDSAGKFDTLEAKIRVWDADTSKFDFLWSPGPCPHDWDTGGYIVDSLGNITE